MPRGANFIIMQFNISNSEGSEMSFSQLNAEIASIWDVPCYQHTAVCPTIDLFASSNWQEVIGHAIANAPTKNWVSVKETIGKMALMRAKKPDISPYINVVDAFESKGYIPSGKWQWWN